MMRYRNFMVKAFLTHVTKSARIECYKDLADRWVKSFKPGEVPPVNEKDIEDTYKHVQQIMER